jgi:uracil-DNA glycosylase family 4
MEGLSESLARRHPLAKCEECPLNDPRNGFVPTLFSKDPTTVAVVGEAPGFQETAHGEPFKGPSGKLLKQVLHYHRYVPSEVMLTNACLCRPPDNATPPKAAINACRGRLMAEIDASGARDVIALGGTASSILVDDPRTITRLRVGPPKAPARALAGSNVERVVPTWHPAYCLRTADAFPALVSDIGKLKEVHVEPWSEPRWAATDDPATAHTWLSDLLVREGPLVVDIEVGIEKDAGFGHPNEYDLLCVGVYDESQGALVFGSGALGNKGILDLLRRLFRRRRLIAHNGKFDLAGLYPHLGGLELWFDTMLASYCLDERPGNHGLKVLAVEKLGAPAYDDEIKPYIPRGGNYGDIPRPILYKYNAMDVAVTWALYKMFSAAFDRDRSTPGLRAVHDHLVAASNQLMYLELNGITIDQVYSIQLGNEFLERIADIETRIDDIVRSSTNAQITTINPRSPKQIHEYFGTQGITVSATDVDTLTARLNGLPSDSDAARFVHALLEHRRQQKLYSTYVQGIRKRMYRGRVYTTYLLHGTTSGRLASRNPNLQNIVRDKRIKRQFVVSRPEHVLIHCDYKQAEARVMATLAQDEYLRRVLSDPEIDIFDDLCAQIHGADWINLSPAARKELRIRIKAFFYGLGYGREAPSIASEFGMPLRDAYQLRDDFMGLIPGVAKWQNDIRKTVLSEQRLVTPFGRVRRFHLITDRNKRDVLNEALSFLPQSTASDICLSALIRLRPMLKGLGFLRLTIHDALVVECHVDRKDEVSDLLKSTMVEAGSNFTDFVPFEVDVSYGQDWGSL